MFFLSNRSFYLLAVAVGVAMIACTQLPWLATLHSKVSDSLAGNTQALQKATAAPRNEETLSNSDLNWPHRLLHVDSMTSFVRETGCIYNGITKPKYNILSYTWGRWQVEGGPSLDVRGIDWPVPSVNPSHFTVEEFVNVIRTVGMGVSFIWIDIACIPQYHANETSDAARIRGEEIGKQARIFGMASKAFAWFNKFNYSMEKMEEVLIMTGRLTQHLNDEKPNTAVAAAAWLGTFDHFVTSLESLVCTFLDHPWLSSLWTLQESILHREALLILGEGTLVFSAVTRYALPISTIRILCDVFTDPTTIRKSVERLKELGELLDEQDVQSSIRIEKFVSRGERITKMAHERGVDVYFKASGNPNPVYSAAQYRTVSNHLDRIYGIMQIYEIACSPEPSGRDKEEKLKSLEDEFGQKLVDRSPLLSQLFVHTSRNAPRRSWLINQQCSVPSPLWDYTRSTGVTSTTLCEFAVSEISMNVHFKGKAWHLMEILTPLSSQQAEKPRFTLKNMTTIWLDAHIADRITGQAANGISGNEALNVAREAVQVYGDTLRVLLLGFSGIRPMRTYIGLVLLRYPTTTGNASNIWTRIGILKWMTENDLNDLTVNDPKPPLPMWHEVEGEIM